MTFKPLAGVFATLFVLGHPLHGAAQEKVVFNLSWLPQGSTVGPIIAESKGFYKAVGLQVESVRGFGGLRTTNEIDQGKFEFGYGNPLGVILNRANGGQTRMIGAVNDQWPGGLCFAKNRNKIGGLADLKGLTVGGGPFSPVNVMLPAWLQMNGLPRDHVKIVQMEPAVMDASFLEGKTDLAECWPGSNSELLAKRAAQAKIDMGIIEYSAYKLDIYGSGIVTSDKLIQAKPALVGRFMRATNQGYEYAFKHPEETADIMVRQFPVLDRAIIVQQIKATEKLMTNADTPQRGLGWMSEARMTNTLDFVVNAYALKQAISVKDIYTTQFLGK
jgi:NitT/TauT family transport system substrate-binding protein